MSAKRWLEGEGQIAADLLRGVAGAPLSLAILSRLIEVVDDPYAPDVRPDVLGRAIERRVRDDQALGNTALDCIEFTLAVRIETGRPIPAPIVDLAEQVLAESGWPPTLKSAIAGKLVRMR